MDRLERRSSVRHPKTNASSIITELREKDKHFAENVGEIVDKMRVRE
jgi:hypothetical protein